MNTIIACIIANQSTCFSATQSCGSSAEGAELIDAVRRIYSSCRVVEVPGICCQDSLHCQMSCIMSAETMLDLTKRECEQCKDVPRLCAAVSLLCQLIACPKPLSSAALQSLLALMINRYPKVDSELPQSVNTMQVPACITCHSIAQVCYNAMSMCCNQHHKQCPVYLAK